MQPKFTLSRSNLMRFWGKVLYHPQTYCWEWQGYTDANGYGRVGVVGYRYYTHRLSYLLAYGEIPNGLHVCHACDNPRCVNPDHLWLGTHLDNIADRTRKGRTVTNGPRGEAHPFAKLTSPLVKELRTRYGAGGISQSQLAREYRISQSTMTRALRGNTWAHIKNERG